MSVPYLQGLTDHDSLFSKLFLLSSTILYYLRSVMRKKYCSMCPKKLDFSFFVKDQTILYTPNARIYSTCYTCREKKLQQKRKRQPSLNPGLHSPP
jgi:hypothetical protein